MRRWLVPAFLLIAANPVLVACDGQAMNVRLVNDTNTTVDFLQCKGKGFWGTGTDCDKVGGRSGYDTAPGEWYTALIGVDATTWYRIEDESGTTLGCLRMKFDHYQKGVEVLASSAQQECPD